MTGSINFTKGSMYLKFKSNSNAYGFGWISYDSDDIFSAIGAFNAGKRIYLIPFLDGYSQPWDGTKGLSIEESIIKFNGQELGLKSHTHSYLPLSGGELTGQLSLRTFFQVYDSTRATRFTVNKDTNGEKCSIYNINNNGDTYKDLIIGRNGAGTGAMFFQASTNRIGIGTASPAEALDVNGNVKAATFIGNIAWASVTGKPSTFAPSSHNHAASEITSGTLAIGRIPTGTTSSTVALGNHTHNYAGSPSPGGAANAVIDSSNPAAIIQLHYSGTGLTSATAGHLVAIDKASESTNTKIFRDISAAEALKFIGAAPSSHTHSYLPLSGGTLTGRLTANGRISIAGYNSTWISGKTITNACICTTTQQTSNSYLPILAVKTQNSHVVNIGGIGDQFGFYGYKASRPESENGTDWSFVFDVSTGNATLKGSISSEGGFFDTSDKRLKSNIKNIELKSKINLYEFDKNGKHSCGVIAQEIEKDYPFAVTENNEGYKFVNYNEVLVLKCKELEEENNSLRNRLDNLEKLLIDKGII